LRELPKIELGEVCDFQNGRAFKKTEWNESGVPIIRIQNLNNKNAAFNLFNGEYDRRIEVNDGDLLFSWSGTVGSSFGPHIWRRGKGVLNQHIFKVGLSKDIDCLYAFYVLRFVTAEIEKNVKGAVGLRHVTKSDLNKFKIPMPDLGEQKSIVAILNEAFIGIDTAIANTKKNLANARELFESYLNSVFTQQVEVGSENKRVSDKRSTQATLQEKMLYSANLELDNGKITKTGGRDATMRHILGELSLSVGMPNTGARNGWKWSPLSDLARLESGHTPSRKHPEYWGGDIPWIGIKDARKNHGHRITDTMQKTNDLGIANSSARILPENTVCLSRTASVGYVLVMGRPMATSQDFVNWVCSNRLAPDFLKYLFLAEGRDGLLRYASGSVHQTIYFPEAKAFHICHPDMDEQARIVDQCDSIREETLRLEANYQQKIEALAELKQSLLQKAFSGELTATKAIPEAILKEEEVA
jgi:type I restriction enzyme S subunit